MNNLAVNFCTLLTFVASSVTISVIVVDVHYLILQLFCNFSVIVIRADVSESDDPRMHLDPSLHEQFGCPRNQHAGLSDVNVRCLSAR